MSTANEIVSPHWPEQEPRDPRHVDPLHVDAAAYRLRVNDAARRKVAQLDGLRVEPPPVVELSDFLAVDDDPTTYRVDKVWPIGGRIVLAAPNKAGKSTLVGNLLRSLADGDKLLDEYAAQPAKVVLIDNELDERTLRRWLREHKIGDTEAVRLLSLRGKVASFDLLDVETRAEWARRLAGADVVILDCLRPVLDALGLDENREAGRFLVAFDALLSAAGVSEALVVHHAGHNGERARGDSRILDWPDALWNIVKDKQEDGVLAGAVPRYFSAYGRDVDVAQSLLGYDSLSRRLSIVGGSRKDARVEAALSTVCHVLAKTGQPMSKNGIEQAVAGAEHARGDVRAAIKLGIQRGMFNHSRGERGSHLLFVIANSTLDFT